MRELAVQLTTDNYITIIVVFIGYLIAGITAFVVLKVNVAENKKDIDSLRNEHLNLKEDMKDSILEIKEIIHLDREENRTDHEDIMHKITSALREDKIDNKEAHDSITKALSSVAINVSGLSTKITQLIEREKIRYEN